MATTRTAKSAAPRLTELDTLAREWLRVVTLEEMLTHPLLFGLTTASPIQRAVCRIAQGRPLAELAKDPTVVEALGGTTPIDGRPAEVAILAGIRTYKSGLAACMGSHAALQCDATGLRPGEQLRVSIVSTKLENAKAVYQHLSGAWKASEALRSLLVTDPDNASDRFTIRRPDGVLVEFLTVAGSRAGAALVSFWQAAVIFDEYARMTGDASEGVVNWTEQRAAVVHRVRRGGYLVHISSPWAPFGPAYDHIAKNWGQPSASLVVLKARADHMNPVYWTPEVVRDAALKDPESYRTDILAEFASPETQFFHVDHLAACTRTDEGDAPYDSRATYTAWMDAATRGNRWTFGIFTRDGKQRILAAGRELAGTRAAPLDPVKVFSETIAPLCKRYNVTTVGADGWSGDAIAGIAATHDIILSARSCTEAETFQRYLDARTILAQGEASLPAAVTHIDAQGEAGRSTQHLTDMLRVKKAVTARGSRAVLPETTDGNHCDWAPTIVGGLSQYVDDLRPVEDTPDARLEREAIEATERMYARENGEDED